MKTCARFHYPLIATLISVTLRFAGAAPVIRQGGATLQSTPQHTYRVFSSTNLVTWVPAAIFGQPVGPNQNLFDPRAPSVYSTTTFSSVVRLSKEGRSSLFYRAVDETNGDAACTQFTVSP